MPANKEYDKDEVRARLEPWLTARYGEAKWVVALEDPSLYLDEKVIASRVLLG